MRIGEICPRCWREHIDAHDARLMEIARTPLAPATVLRTLSRIGRPDLVAAIAARGDRVPDDLREQIIHQDRVGVLLSYKQPIILVKHSLW